MSQQSSLVFPTSTGEVEMSREVYTFLTEEGGLPKERFASVIAAAQILSEVVPHEARSFREILRRIDCDRDGSPSITEKRAMAALVRAELVTKEGTAKSTVYRSPGRRVR